MDQITKHLLSKHQSDPKPGCARHIQKAPSQWQSQTEWQNSRPCVLQLGTGVRAREPTTTGRLGHDPFGSLLLPFGFADHHSTHQFLLWGQGLTKSLDTTTAVKGEGGRMTVEAGPPPVDPSLPLAQNHRPPRTLPWPRSKTQGQRLLHCEPFTSGLLARCSASKGHTLPASDLSVKNGECSRGPLSIHQIKHG